MSYRSYNAPGSAADTEELRDSDSGSAVAPAVEISSYRWTFKMTIVREKEPQLPPHPRPASLPHYASL